MTEPRVLSLSALRLGLDAVDDALIVLTAVRGCLATQAGRVKRLRALPLRSPAREREVQQRAHRLGHHLGLAPATVERMIQLLIDDACRRQSIAAADLDQGVERDPARTLAALRQPSSTPRMSAPAPQSLLRLLPPPRRWAPLLRWLPPATLAQAFQRAATQALAPALARGELAALDGRVLAIEPGDLELCFAVRVQGACLRIDPLCANDAIEARVRGSLTDLLLLASRLEDADTLFFQRRLSVSGDTELGLLARNLLDQLDWSQIPLPLRIALNRAAKLAESARRAWREAQVSPLPAVRT